MKTLKRILITLLVIAVILTAFFIAGRYGWKLGGFRACQGAGINSVEVTENAVHMTGDFDITIPTEGDIQEVIIKTDMVETSIWNAQTAAAEVG